jgi:hypothetical protein
MAILPVRVLYLQGFSNFVADMLSRPFNGQTKMKSDDEENESLAVNITDKNTDYTVVKTIYNSNEYLQPGIAATLAAVREEGHKIKNMIGL